jgi:DNA anti-recombination protein RmuC
LKIYISSPSTFIQFINTIDKISFDLNLVNEIDKFKEELKAIISPIKNFVKNSKEGIENLNKAFNKNLMSIEDKFPKIENSIDRISQRNLINNKEVIDIN